MSNFKLVSSTKASNVIPVNKYVSDRTGLTVVIANVEGPLVSGYFCLATEAHDDDGLPHTLEHLIFLGSKRYPYKGILDLLANRCMAQGTNAWTDTDHTCYTVDTAGDQGMLTLLPIYLDHILRPTLTDEGFITEVHHIDGTGEDAGVVYCEMQGRENNADSRCELRLVRAMYPESGYCSETGGILKNLRTSTTNTKVREFHKKFYRPENMTVILTGQIKAEDVFSALKQVEDDITEQREQEQPEEWVKPWQTLPPPPQYGEIKEQWPADVEDCGQVLFAWRGPNITQANGLKELTSCALLLRYLCETAAAPLQRCLVEREDALAADVSFNLTENIVSCIKIELDNVPVQKLQSAKDEAVKCLKSVRDGKEPIDISRMRILLKKQLREGQASLEVNPHTTVAFRAIGDALYSTTDEHFIGRMNPQEHMHELLEENSDYWLCILQKYFTDECIVVIGSPSIELQTKMAEEENTRIEKQRADLGENGLEEKDKKLQAAIEFNERPAPSDTLSAVPVPACDRFQCHRCVAWSSGGDPCPYFDLAEMPLYTRVHSLTTNFVYINLIFDTTAVDVGTRQWICILLNGFGECPVRRGDKLIPHEEVISTTEQLTVMLDNNIGISQGGGNFSVGDFVNTLHVETRCEPEDYESVVNHLYEILYAAEFTKERLLVFAQRLMNDAANVRRRGSRIASDMVKDAVFNEDTNVHWCSVLRQQKFLKALIEQLNGADAEEAVIQAKDAFRKIFQDVWLHISSDFERYKLSTEPWKKFGNVVGTPEEPRLYSDADLLTTKGGGCVVGVGGVESAYVETLASGPTGALPAELAPVLVAINYFTQLEGPMWRLIRGCGLAYGYNVVVASSKSRLRFTLYRATNAPAAYAKAESILKEFVSSGQFDKDLLTSARSSALFAAMQTVKCPADVVDRSLINYVHRLPDTYSCDLVTALASVEAEDAVRAALRWLPAVFDRSRGDMAIVCHPSKVNEMQKAFEKMNIKLDAYESMEASPFNK